MLRILLVLFFMFSQAMAMEFSTQPAQGSAVEVPKPDNAIVLTKQNLVTLRGEIDGTVVTKAILALTENTAKEPVLYIISPGGSVAAGLQLVRYIQDSPRKITCVADVAASMAFIITQACHVRVVTEASLLMQHQPSFALEGPTENFKSAFAFTLRMINSLEKAQAKRIGISVEQYRANVLSDWWMFGSEAVELGTADTVKAVRCSTELASETTSESVMTMFGPIDVVFSKCPLARAPLKINFNAIYENEKQQKIYRDITNFEPNNISSKARELLKP